MEIFIVEEGDREKGKKSSSCKREQKREQVEWSARDLSMGENRGESSLSLSRPEGSLFRGARARMTFMYYVISHKNNIDDSNLLYQLKISRLSFHFARMSILELLFHTFCVNVSGHFVFFSFSSLLFSSLLFSSLLFSSFSSLHLFPSILPDTSEMAAADVGKTELGRVEEEPQEVKENLSEVKKKIAKVEEKIAEAEEELEKVKRALENATGKGIVEIMLDDSSLSEGQKKLLQRLEQLGAEKLQLLQDKNRLEMKKERLTDGEWHCPFSSVSVSLLFLFPFLT